MKTLALILLWLSIGVGSTYSYRIYVNKPYYIEHAVLGSALGPIVLLMFGLSTISNHIPSCLANCKDK